MSNETKPDRLSVAINMKSIGIDKIVEGAVVGALNALADEGIELTPARLRELAKKVESKASGL